MAEILLELDEDLLSEAAAALGTTTAQETVTEALRRAIASSRENFHFDRLAELDD